MLEKRLGTDRSKERPLLEPDCGTGLPAVAFELSEGHVVSLGLKIEMCRLAVLRKRIIKGVL